MGVEEGGRYINSGRAGGLEGYTYTCTFHLIIVYRGDIGDGIILLYDPYCLHSTRDCGNMFIFEYTAVLLHSRLHITYRCRTKQK